MKVSETSRKAYDGIVDILGKNGQSLSKSQAYAVERLVQTVEESTERRCCEVTQQILARKDALVDECMKQSDGVSEKTVERVNSLVEGRIQQLKKEMPELVDYARLKRLQQCVESIKDFVGYSSDAQVSKVAAESANLLHGTKNLLQAQAKTISEKTASLAESMGKIENLNRTIQQMQSKIDQKEQQILESAKRSKELSNSVQLLQGKIEESKKINETIEQKRKSESLKFYLESKIAQYPRYEAGLLRKHFQNAKSRAEIDENFQKALTMVGEKMDSMRQVQPIPVAKAVQDACKKNGTPQANSISGETIVGESGGQDIIQINSEIDDSFVDIDNDVISNEEMERWMSRL